MPAKRRLYPGDPEGGPPKPAPPRKPDKIEIYTVFWKDFDDRQKGTIWIYHSRELREAGGLTHDKDIPWSTQGYRPSLLIARGKKWRAIYSDQEQYSFLASPMATKKVMARIASRWTNPPLKLQPASAPAFRLLDLIDELHSHVYIVQLLTFEQTVTGRCYYKIGKAKSIPARIKQFGPCRLIASIKLKSEEESLRVESELHEKFSHLRRQDTEIFCFSGSELLTLKAECERYTVGEEECS